MQSNYRPVDTDIVRERVLLNIDGDGAATRDDLESGSSVSPEPVATTPSRSSPPSVGGLSSVYGKPVELEDMRSTTALQTQPAPEGTDVATPQRRPSTATMHTADEHGLMTPPLSAQREMPGSVRSFATARMEPFVDVNSEDDHEHRL